MPTQDATGHPVIEEVFLTPRVIDQRAFEDYSRTLRDLMEQVSGEGGRLKETAEEAAGAGGAARSTIAELRLIAERAGAIAKALQDRVSKAQTVLDRAGEQAVSAERVDERISKLTRERLEALERRVRTLLDSAEAAVGEREAKQAEQVAALTRAIEARLGQAERRASELEASFSARIDELESDRAGRLVSALEAIEAKIDHAEQRADGTVSGLDQRLTELAERAVVAIERLEARLAPLESRAGEHGDALDARLERLNAAFDARVAQIKDHLGAASGPIITGLTVLIRRGVDLLGSDPRQDDHEGPKDGSLGAIVARGASLLDRAEFASRQAESLRSQADRAQKILGDLVIEATEWIEGLERRRGALAEQIGPLADSITSLERLLSGRSEQVTRLADALDPELVAKGAEQAGRIEELLQALVDAGAVVRSLRSETDGASARLQAIRVEQQRVQRALDSAPWPESQG
ncbi:MAG: hypothetical protein H6811_02825 [Phycisphaeraceae bacterium]|nr:hypothetical protein [Phycisphaeraceae bacterium]